MWIQFYFVVILTISCALSQNIDTENNDTSSIQPNMTSSSTSSPIVISSTLKPENASCELYNNNCDKCVKSSEECFYCESDKKCKHFNFYDCELTKKYFKTCKFNFQIMVISVSVVAGVVLLIIAIACCCCCCRRNGIKISKDELKWARQREERKQIQEERKKERAQRTEQIRQKYGLVKDSNPYQRFDD